MKGLGKFSFHREAKFMLAIHLLLPALGLFTILAWLFWSYLKEH
jgi:hypothetical protein